MSTHSDLKTKINNKSAVITVMGLGYVGLPIAFELCKKGFKVNGLDTNPKRVKQLKNKESYIEDISSKEVRKICTSGKFDVTTDDSIIGSSDVVIVCVPTPLRKTIQPDISYIVHATKSLNKYMHSGQLIIVESTTYPGTTREVILPELEKNGHELDKDFYLAFSPERIDPGNEKYSLTNIPKVVGGVTQKSTKLSKLLYSKIIDSVVEVSNARTAEVTKLLENTFRIVNIGLINEFAMLCHKLDIDVWEVLRAAKTKPFGFMPFYPGPGIGGHCIPADPMYLSWKAKTVGFKTEMIDLAAYINRMLPEYVVERACQILKSNKNKLIKSNVLILGVAYKKDVNDLRESPALEIIKGLKKKKITVSYHDDHIPYIDLAGAKLKSRKLTNVLLKKQDLVLVVSDHSYLDYRKIANNSKVILDTRNVFEKEGIKEDNIVKL